MTLVFSHTVYDGEAGRTIVAAHKKTTEAIERCNGALLKDTAEEVDASLIDEQGRYLPERRPDKSQRDRFIETARKLGADEDEAAFKEKLAVIARQRPKNEPEPSGKGE